MMLKPCIIFDIDGTVADLQHRVHHVNGKKKNWKAFMEELVDDKPMKQTIELNRMLDSHDSRPIVLCTGRSENERATTEKWLHDNGVKYTKMYMRKAGDYRADSIIKAELLDEIRADGLDPELIFDDRQCVVDMWRDKGLFVLQCDPHAGRTEHHGFEFHESQKYPLTILVGPSGSGKSTWIDFNRLDQMTLSSDAFREHLTGDFRSQEKNDQVFEAMHDIAKTRLLHGIPTILDATHLKNKDRIKAATLVPDYVPVSYVVIDRPLEEKMKTAGWRSSVFVHGKSLVEYHDQVFKSNLKDILAGDGLPNVKVFDKRTYK